MNKPKSFLFVFISSLLWISVILWLAVIFIFSSQNSTESAELSENVLSSFAKILGFISNAIGQTVIRKLAHMFEFFVLAILIFSALSYSSSKLRPIFSAILSLVFAISDEIHQIFVPGRACRLFDIGVDFLGILLAIVGVYFIITALKKRKTKNPRIN